jgi:hypothetical protein
MQALPRADSSQAGVCPSRATRRVRGAYLIAVFLWLCFTLNSYTHIDELDTAACFWRFTSGVMLAGFVAGAACWVISRRHGGNKRDRVLTIASTVSLSVLTANVVLYVLAALSMGFALTDSVVSGVLGVGLAAGVGLGLIVKQENNGDVVDTNALLCNSETNARNHMQVDDKPQSNEQEKKGNLHGMRRLTWWWRVPAYFVIQFFMYNLICSLDWPIGSDVFGPYKSIPDWVDRAFWGQFILVPFLSWRAIGFVLFEFAIAGMVTTIPNWPRNRYVHSPEILVPAWVWVGYWIQFLLVALAVWRISKCVCESDPPASSGIPGASGRS